MDYLIKGKQVQVYDRIDCAVFLKTKEKYGGLSNMANGYQIIIKNIVFNTPEALYQACRFPNHPEIQQEIIEQKSPIAAKMKSRHYLKYTRLDWTKHRVNIMKLVVYIKLLQHTKSFGELLLSTNNLEIVEESSKNDYYWGTIPLGKNVLVGVNMFGRILKNTREEFKKNHRDLFLESLELENFLFQKTNQ